jgi:hypothetical protein
LAARDKLQRNGASLFIQHILTFGTFYTVHGWAAYGFISPEISPYFVSVTQNHIEAFFSATFNAISDTEP